MAKKAKYEIDLMYAKGKQEVSGEIYGEWWGIHKNEAQKLYVLTHLPTGKRVWSSSKKRKLVELLQEPEFFDPPQVNDRTYLKNLSQVITRFCDKNGWN